MNSLGSRIRGEFPSGGTEAERLRYLVTLAVMAPSGHNTQPWRFRISGHELHILADRSRALPVVDPDDRELIISCGAALEHLLIAARCHAQRPVVELFPGPDPDHLATVRLEGEATASAREMAMFDAMPRRRTTRTGYADRQISGTLRQACVRLAAERGVVLTVISDKEKRRSIADLVAEGDRRQFADPDFRAELASWVRSRRSGRRDGLSGAGFGMPDILSPVSAAMIHHFDLGKAIGAGDQGKVLSSPQLAMLSTEEDSPASWVATGRALAAVLLNLTAAGATAAFMNQPVEVDTLRRQLATAARVATIPQLLMRIGYALEVPASPRRSASEVITDARPPNSLTGEP